MTKKSKNPKSEWIGGIIELPISIQEPKIDNPELVVWLSGDGFVLGQNMLNPEEGLSALCASLDNTMRTPLMAPISLPNRLRVASKEMADVLRAGFPHLEVSCSPTPEIDEFAESIIGHFERGPDLALLHSDVTPDQMAWFFEQAANYYRKKPWKTLSRDESIYLMKIRALDVFDLVLVMVGCDGTEFGLLVFEDLEDYDTYLDFASDPELASGPEGLQGIPPHLMLLIEPKDNVPASVLDEITTYGWKVASRNAYPMPFHVDEHGHFSPASSEELTILGAGAEALSLVKKDHKAIRYALESHTGFGRSLKCSIPSGTTFVELTLTAPARMEFSDDEMWQRLCESDLLAKVNYDERRFLEAQLLDLFRDSPEAKAIAEVAHSPIIIDIAANYFGHTLATLPASDLRELLFDIIPAKVMMPASEATEMIEEMRALYTFLGRRFEFQRVDACQKILGRKAISTLEKKLSDPGNMGIGKSLLMGGLDGGFDMQSMEGIQEWMALNMAKPIPTNPKPTKNSKGTDKKK